MKTKEEIEEILKELKETHKWAHKEYQKGKEQLHLRSLTRVQITMMENLKKEIFITEAKIAMLEAILEDGDMEDFLKRYLDK